jgi:hypothetical protein
VSRKEQGARSRLSRRLKGSVKLKCSVAQAEKEGLAKSRKKGTARLRKIAG